MEYLVLIWDRIFCYEIRMCVNGASYGLNGCDQWKIKFDIEQKLFNIWD